LSYIDLIIYKTYAELRRDIAQVYLGMLWWIIEPLMYMGAFYFIFSAGVRSGGENYASFLLCGLTSWKWFSSTLNQAANSVVAHRGLIQQVYIPKVVLPLIPVLVNWVKFFFILVLLLIFLWFMGFSPTWYWLNLIPVILVELLLVVGCSLVLAALVPFLMDLRVLVTNGLVLLMFLSGIFFLVDDFPPELQIYLYLNPMVSIIESFRTVLLDSKLPNWGHLAGVTVFSLFLIALGWGLFKRFDRHYAKVLS